jgi:hypothetical protein
VTFYSEEFKHALVVVEGLDTLSEHFSTLANPEQCKQLAGQIVNLLIRLTLSETKMTNNQQKLRSFLKHIKLNVTSEWLDLLLRSRNVLGSNLDPVALYPDMIFMGSFYPSSQNVGIALQIMPRPLPSIFCPIDCSLIIYFGTI